MMGLMAAVVDAAQKWDIEGIIMSCHRIKA